MTDRNKLQLEAQSAAARELDRQFLAAYGRLADEGACDAPGGGEYQRVKAEWIAAGRPTVDPFIRRRANVVPGAEGKLPPV